MSATQPTAQGATIADPPPPDLAVMRETAQIALGPTAGPHERTPAAELTVLTATLRGHIEILAPEVERAAARLPDDSPTLAAALACVGEARGKLRAPELGFAMLTGGVMYARRLARVLHALCDHYETVSLGIVRTPVQAAFDQLAEHCLRCPTCRTVDEQGAHAGLPCDEESRLYEAYRAARAATARFSQRREESTV